MIPILFNYNATSFTTHGIGDLRETIACETAVNSEGEYELELQYPVGGEYISGLTYNNIILAKANDHDDYQAFRIYGVSKAINSLVTVKAQHISYDLSCVPVINYESTTCRAAIEGLLNHAVGTGADLFSFYTDIPDSQQAENQDREFKMEEPLTLRAALLDGDDSIKGCWGGDLVFDNYSVKLLKTAGADRGVLIEYGIDMIDMEQEENISEMITGVFPYWKGREEDDDSSDEDMIVCGSVQYAAGTFQRQRIIPLNVTDYYPNNTSAPTPAQIEQTAREWMTANDAGKPVINLTISYAELGKDVRLHDAITVRFVKIGIDVKAKVISYKYDVLKERCIEVEVGSVKPSILFSLEDASRLKRGLIPPKRIANNSIDSDKIENYSIDSDNLSTGSVNSRTIEDEAVTTDKITDWAITTDKLGDMVVTTAKVKDGNITSGKISDNAVITGKIADGAVVEAKIGNSAITSAKIQDGSVINAKVGNAAITTEKVANLAIDNAKIGNSAITSVKIDNGAVVNGKIGNQQIDFRTVKDAEIDQLSLNQFSITSSKISTSGSHYHYKRNSDGSVTKGWVQDEEGVDSDNIKNYSIVSTKIGEQEISTTHFDENLNQWIVDVDAAVWLVVNTISWSQAEGAYLDVQHLVAGHSYNYLEVTGSGTSLGSNVSIWGETIGSAVVKDEFDNSVTVLKIG